MRPCKQKQDGTPLDKPANDTPQPVNLFNGDMRLETLYCKLREEIYERCSGTDIPVLAVVGVLEKIKLDIIKETFWDD